MGYRYMDWLLTVPMLLMEIVLVMKLSSQEATAKCCTLGVSSAAMIILGYPGELTVVSWLTYPVVYVFPMIGFSGARAVVAIQVGYCVSDIISKCGVGLIIYSITSAKSELYHGALSKA